jgi:hypothetical protein
MRQSVYYVIRPTDALRQSLARYPGDLSDILLRPMLLANDEPDRSPWRELEHLARVKLLHLAYLQMEYSADGEFKEALGDFSLDCATFDRWWSVERHLVDEALQDIEKRLDQQTARSLKPTGVPLVDEWIAGLKA